MKIFEITQPRKSTLFEAVGRDLQHIEDLVFINGVEGAVHAVQRLRAVGVDSKTMTIKWDGCIHPDSVVQTDAGEKTISDVIDLWESGKKCSVLAHDFDTGENVVTPVVLAAKTEGIKNWICVELENGDIIQLTEDHPIFTINRGWVDAVDLTVDDDIKEL